MRFSFYFYQFYKGGAFTAIWTLSSSLAFKLRRFNHTRPSNHSVLQFIRVRLILLSG